MKIFDCPNCKSPLYFENTKCVSCGIQVGFDPIELNFHDCTTVQNDFDNNLIKYCKNEQFEICNWLTPQAETNTFCIACALNRKVPNVDDNQNFQKWTNLEIAKHRLIYQLLRLRLPLVSKLQDPQGGLAFDFLSQDNPDNIMTGHDSGIITIILAEADSVHREQLRKQMSEPYRTLLGHFRHEIGHYYWPLLFNGNTLENFRSFFGNERIDYGQSLKNYYELGSIGNWNESFISKYASSHPWEDWAETWAHYLHLMDTLETAGSLGLSLSPVIKEPTYLAMEKAQDPYLIEDFKTIFDASVSLTCAANNLNRSMGLHDIYPFVIPDPVFKKLNFIHETLKMYRANNLFL